jgi:predicted transposase YdaD
VQEYDVALKSVLRGSAKLTMRELTGTAVARWLDVELPKVQNAQNPRLDLLAETVDGGLVHVELQSGNDASMPLRMAEYCLGIFRQFKRFPRQIVLYVGEPELRMEKELRGSNVWFEYSLIDIRMLDGERLLASEDVGDNVIAILAGLRDDEGAVCKIVERISGLAAAEREIALAQLTILAGLRHLSKTVAREARKMPIDLDIRDHEVLGPMFIEAEQKGVEKGIQKGIQKGLHAGELTVLRRLTEKRFGALPGWAGEKLAALSTSELEDLSERLLDAKSLEELLR